MKFFKGQENDRIYCKEVKRGDKTLVVIMGVLHSRKKSTRNTKREEGLIRRVASYSYPDDQIHEKRPSK